MVTRKRRAKNEPSQGDLLAQAYRNRAAMRRVYESAIDSYLPFASLYWTPRNMDEWENQHDRNSISDIRSDTSQMEGGN